MPGLRQPLSAHIQQIRNDLRERYKGGFPILKELMQNADDAGGGVEGASASELVLLLAKGIPDSHHVLLQTPGLCLVNDGDFTAADAISISSYGSSNRGSQSATVGRFGLGLKSVFHWAEAFFYFSSANFTESGNGCPPFDLLHPWISRETGHGFHKDWDHQWAESKNLDHAQFEAIARTLLKSERWFGLWIPFRAKSLLNGVEPVLPEWPLGTDGQEASYESLFGADWEQRVSEVLPLLRRLRRIRFCRQGAGGVEEGLALSVEEPSRRMSFLAANGHEFRPGPAGLDGRVSVRKGVGATEAVSFAGIEKLPGTENAVQWQDHRFWPRPFVQTENGGEESRPEKAAEHGAVAFVRQRAAEGQVRIQPAVFLPLGEPEMRPIKGGASYAIFLHGHFFVDSGRRDIERFDDMADDTAFETVGSEEELRKLWNRTLMRDVVAPLVLPSLDAFVRQERMEVGDVEVLVDAMEKSKTLKPHSPWMCRGQRFILRLLQAGSAWERQTWNDEPSRWLELPTPDFPETRLFSLMPALAALSSQIAVSLEGKPHLADYRQKPVSPSDEELAELLGSVPVSAFSDPRHLAYLLKLIPQNASERKSDSPLTAALVLLANQLVSHPLPKDEGLAKLWKQFFKQITTSAFVGLPAKSTEASPEISRVLADSKLPVALLWQDFRDAEGHGSIIWLALLPALKGIGGLAFKTEDAINQRSGVATRLLETSTGKPPDWTAQIRHLALFAAREPDKTACAVSLGDMQAVNADGRLFTGGEPCAKDLAKAAPELKPILVQLAVGKVLDLQAPDCDAAACVKLLRNAARLASDFTSRKPLFERLLQVARPNDADFWEALRCLLHGNITAWEPTVTLFDETGAAPALLQLLKKALAVANQQWRRVAASTVGQLGLTAQQRQRLNLVSASEANIEALIQEVEPAKLDCSDLSTEDCDFILERFNDIEVVRGLNIHETVDKNRVRIGPHTYVDDGTFRDLPAMCRVTRLRDRPGYARFRHTDGFRALNWEAVVEIELDQPNPVREWGVILTAIGHLGTLRTELRERVRAIAWLPLPYHSAVKPSQLLDLPRAESELDRLPPEVLNGYLPLLRLAEAVRQHEKFDTFRHAVLSPLRETLDTLANLLRAHSNWSTGLSGECTTDQITDWVKTLADAPEEALPVARLVKVIHGEHSVGDLLPAFFQHISGRLKEDAYAALLKHLAKVQEAANAEARERILNVEFRYLCAVAESGCTLANRVIETDGVRLISRSGAPREPQRLAFADPSLHPEDQLDDRLSQALSSLRPTRPNCPEPATIVADAAEQPAAVLIAALRGYFNPWRALMTPCEPVGALLSLLGSDAHALSSEFFSTWSPEEVMDWFEGADQADPTLGRIRDRIRRREFRITIVTEPNALVWSILGNEFTARLADQPTTLLVPDEGYSVVVVQEAGRLVCRLRLRKLPLDRGNYTEEMLVSLLRETVAVVLAEGLRATVDVRPLFEKLSKATQLQVAVAQNMIIDQALAFLRQIGAQSHPSLREALGLWDDARRQEAVEEVHELASHRSTELRRKARDNIRSLLAGEPQVQAVVLGGVKRKLSEFQYTASSVPFELWQNADDAVAELVKLGFDPNQASTLGFVVGDANDALVFVHWGRLINEFAGTDGSNCRGAGFDRDLEKMLVPAISDKSEISAQGQAALTGKFGLGFKSVFLISDAPEVLSGNVDFAIRGGIYPVRLDDAQRTTLERALGDMAPGNRRRGTLIRLPLRGNGGATVDQVLGLFRDLAPLLVVFSRRLKRLRFRSPNQEEREVRWHPQPIVEGISSGEVECLDGVVRNAFVLARDVGCDRVQFLLALGTHGFVPLPDHFPVFWVTAPTRATPGYGFAVNGPFDPEVGRVQLALQSEKNRQLAGDLARVVSNRLAMLWQEATGNWDKLRNILGMATAATPQDFWDSLWQVLARRFADKCRKDDGSPEATLARRMLWESEADGMRLFYRMCAALPTGLWGTYRTLTCLPDLHYSATGALDGERAFDIVSGWPIFQKKVPVRHICSHSQVASTLEQVGVRLEAVQQVHLASAVDWELGEARRADPELAARLGLLITPGFLRNLVEGKPGERNEREHIALNELLAKTQFQATDGSWHTPTQLLVAVGEGVVPEEKLRAAFAPQESRLNQAYSGSALDFFLACRPRLEADVETMTTWVLQARVEEIQVAALVYLLKGESKERLAEELRRQRDDSNWLWRLGENAWFQIRFTADEQHQICAYILRLFDDDLRQRTLTPPVPPPPGPEPVHVWTVAELWKWWHEQGEPTGDYTLEGEANWELFHGGALWGEEERKAELKRLLLSPGDPGGKVLWYRLFGYACLVSAGRTMTELREFWKYQLNPRHFWERTSEGDFSERTQEIFEQAVTARFTDMAAGGEQAYFWRRLFYDIRKVHRMVQNDFPAVLLDLVNQGHGEHLRQFLRTGHLPGPDQRPWVGTFGQSADTPLGFIIRELVRIEVITEKAVLPYAFYVCRPVLRALTKIGWIADADSGFSGEGWLAMLQTDPENGPKLLPYHDIPLLHLGITHRGDKMPRRPE